LGTRKVKGHFLEGFAEMCKRLEPKLVLCYDEPFEEMLQMADIKAFPYQGLLVRGKATIKGVAL
jgi:hypothetical protein